MATHEAKCADVDRVMARLERELHLLESDYQSTLQAEQANQGGACQNSNGSSVRHEIYKLVSTRMCCICAR